LNEEKFDINKGEEKLVEKRGAKTNKDKNHDNEE